MARVLMRGTLLVKRRPQFDDDGDPIDRCAHEWECSGSAYGGDDDRWHGEGRVYCTLCGADGDA